MIVTVVQSSFIHRFSLTINVDGDDCVETRTGSEIEIVNLTEVSVLPRDGQALHALT